MKQWIRVGSPIEFERAKVGMQIWKHPRKEDNIKYESLYQFYKMNTGKHDQND